MFLISFFSFFFYCHYYCFEYISGVLTFPIDTIYMVIQSWHLIVLYFLFHGLHFVTTLRVLKLVLSFHVTSFHYGAKGVRDIDGTCRCHQSNIMPDIIFSVNITQCITCGCCLFLCMCVCLGVIFWTPFIYRKKVFSFFTITLGSLGKP